MHFFSYSKLPCELGESAAWSKRASPGCRVLGHRMRLWSVPELCLGRLTVSSSVPAQCHVVCEKTSCSSALHSACRTMSSCGALCPTLKPRPKEVMGVWSVLSAKETLSIPPLTRFCLSVPRAPSYPMKSWQMRLTNFTRRVID